MSKWIQKEEIIGGFCLALGALLLDLSLKEFFGVFFLSVYFGMINLASNKREKERKEDNE